MVFHGVLKEVLLDREWAKSWGYKCFSGDSRPFYFSPKVEYRPDAVWESKNRLLSIVEIPLTEDERAVVGEFYLACAIKNARYFYAMVNEGREWLKPYLHQAWKTLMDLTDGYEHPNNCPMFKPSLVVIPRELGNNRERVRKYLDKAWK